MARYTLVHDIKVCSITEIKQARCDAAKQQSKWMAAAFIDWVEKNETEDAYEQLQKLIHSAIKDYVKQNNSEDGHFEVRLRLVADVQPIEI